MSKLNPYTLSKIYTLSEIETEIAFYKDQLQKATVRSYDKDTTQGRQKVESAEIDKIADILQAWIKAKDYISGTGKPRIINANFGNRGF